MLNSNALRKRVLGLVLEQSGNPWTEILPGSVDSCVHRSEASDILETFDNVALSCGVFRVTASGIAFLAS